MTSSPAVPIPVVAVGGGVLSKPSLNRDISALSTYSSYSSRDLLRRTSRNHHHHNHDVTSLVRKAALFDRAKSFRRRKSSTVQQQQQQQQQSTTNANTNNTVGADDESSPCEDNDERISGLFEANDAFTEEENAILLRLSEELKTLRDYDILDTGSTRDSGRHRHHQPTDLDCWDENTLVMVESKHRVSESIKRMSLNRLERELQLADAYSEFGGDDSDRGGGVLGGIHSRRRRNSASIREEEDDEDADDEEQEEEERGIMKSIRQLSDELGLLQSSDHIPFWDEESVATVETKQRLSQSIQKRVGGGDASIQQFLQQELGEKEQKDTVSTTTTTTSLSDFFHKNTKEMGGHMRQQQHLKPPQKGIRTGASYLPGRFARQQSHNKLYRIDSSERTKTTIHTAASEEEEEDDNNRNDIGSLVRRASLLMDPSNNNNWRRASVQSCASAGVFEPNSAFTEEENAILVQLSQELKTLQDYNVVIGGGGGNSSSFDSNDDNYIKDRNNNTNDTNNDPNDDDDYWDEATIVTVENKRRLSQFIKQMSLHRLELELQQADIDQHPDFVVANPAPSTTAPVAAVADTATTPPTTTTNTTVDTSKEGSDHIGDCNSPPSSSSHENNCDPLHHDSEENESSGSSNRNTDTIVDSDSDKEHIDIIYQPQNIDSAIAKSNTMPPQQEDVRQVVLELDPAPTRISATLGNASDCERQRTTSISLQDDQDDDQHLFTEEPPPAAAAAGEEEATSELDSNSFSTNADDDPPRRSTSTTVDDSGSTTRRSSSMKHCAVENFVETHFQSFSSPFHRFSQRVDTIQARLEAFCRTLGSGGGGGRSSTFCATRISTSSTSDSLIPEEEEQPIPNAAE